MLPSLSRRAASNVADLYDKLFSESDGWDSDTASNKSAVGCSARRGRRHGSPRAALVASDRAHAGNDLPT